MNVKKKKKKKNKTLSVGVEEAKLKTNDIHFVD